jgi:hypothetical protein
MTIFKWWGLVLALCMSFSGLAITLYAVIRRVKGDDANLLLEVGGVGVGLLALGLITLAITSTP